MKDLKECIACYEFVVIPRSLFAPDGSILLAYDKSKILYGLENIVQANDRLQENPEVAVNIILTDSHQKSNTLWRNGISICNKKTSDIQTCADFANAFINLLIKSSTG